LKKRGKNYNILRLFGEGPLKKSEKLETEAVDATKAAWSTAGLRRNSPQLPSVLGALCDFGFEVNQGLQP